RLPAERAAGVLAMALAVPLRPVPVPFDAGPGEDRQRLRRLAEQTKPDTEPVLGLLTLTSALRRAGGGDLAERLLPAAGGRRPQEVVLHFQLGNLLEQQRPPRWREAVECYAAARALRPGTGTRLAHALENSGRVEEGLALWERLAADKADNP